MWSSWDMGLRGRVALSISFGLQGIACAYHHTAQHHLLTPAFSVGEVLRRVWFVLVALLWSACVQVNQELAVRHSRARRGLLPPLLPPSGLGTCADCSVVLNQSNISVGHRHAGMETQGQQQSTEIDLLDTLDFEQAAGTRQRQVAAFELRREASRRSGGSGMRTSGVQQAQSPPEGSWVGTGILFWVVTGLICPLIWSREDDADVAALSSSMACAALCGAVVLFPHFSPDYSAVLQALQISLVVPWYAAVLSVPNLPISINLVTITSPFCTMMMAVSTYFLADVDAYPLAAANPKLHQCLSTQWGQLAVAVMLLAFPALTTVVLLFFWYGLDDFEANPTKWRNFQTYTCTTQTLCLTFWSLMVLWSAHNQQ